MYCEDSAAAHIDHFQPRANSPLTTFIWDNYLLACSICNSNFKRDEFPVSPGGEPLLINPTIDEPADHLVFSSATGKYDPIPGSAKANESIRVFGLNRDVLERARKDAWRLFEIGIVAYDRELNAGQQGKADGIEALLVRLPFAGVLRSLLSVARGSRPDLLDPDCLEAIRRRPEVMDWG